MLLLLLFFNIIFIIIVAINIIIVVVFVVVAVVVVIVIVIVIVVKAMERKPEVKPVGRLVNKVFLVVVHNYVVYCSIITTIITITTVRWQQRTRFSCNRSIQSIIFIIDLTVIIIVVVVVVVVVVVLLLLLLLKGFPPVKWSCCQVRYSKYRHGCYCYYYSYCYCYYQQQQ